MTIPDSNQDRPTQSHEKLREPIIEQSYRPDSAYVPPTAQIRDQAIAKFNAAWGAAYTDGERTLETAIDLYYSALFDPEQAGQAEHADSFPGRREDLEGAMGRALPEGQSPPTREEFIREMLGASNRQADYSPSLKDDTLPALRELAELGSLHQWSHGDNIAQAHRMRSVGIGDLRREIATERTTTSGQTVGPQEVMGVIVGDKFEALTNEFSRMLEESNDNGATGESGERRRLNTSMFIDDRVENLQRVRRLSEAFASLHDIEVPLLLVWIHANLQDEDIERAAEGAGLNVEQFRSTYHPVSSLSEVVELARELPESSEIFIDFDDTQTADNKRKEIMLESILDTLEDRHWI